MLIDYFLGFDDVDELQQEIEDYLNENGSQLGEFFTMIEFLHSNGQFF